MRVALRTLSFDADGTSGDFEATVCIADAETIDLAGDHDSSGALGPVGTMLRLHRNRLAGSYFAFNLAKCVHSAGEYPVSVCS